MWRKGHFSGGTGCNSSMRRNIFRIVLYSLIPGLAMAQFFCVDQLGKIEDYNTFISVTGVTPASNTSGIALNSTISVQFNDSIDMNTVTSSTFSVNSGAVTGTFTYDDSTHTVTFTPDYDLNYDEVYTVKLTNGIMNTNKQYMASDYTWSFSTLNYYFNTAAVTPVNGASNVTVNSAVTARFDDNIDLATVTSSTFVISPPKSGTYTYDSSSMTVTFTPGSNFSANTTYGITLTTGIKDTSGSFNMASDYTWSFTTNNGSQPAIALVSPVGNVSQGGSYYYGNTAISATKSAAFTIWNNGTATLTPTGISLSGTDSSLFSVTYTPAAINAGSSDTFTVGFTPTSGGSKSAVMTITSDDPNYPSFNVNLTGTGATYQEIQVTHNSTILVSATTVIGFGTVTMPAGKTFNLVITNIGSAILQINGYSIAGTNPGEFSTDLSSHTYPVFINPGNTLNFTITFTPASTGIKTARINIQHNDAATGSPFRIPVRGKGH